MKINCICNLKWCFFVFIIKLFKFSWELIGMIKGSKIILSFLNWLNVIFCCIGVYKWLGIIFVEKVFWVKIFYKYSGFMMDNLKYDIVVFELRGLVMVSDKVFIVCFFMDVLKFGIKCYIIGFWKIILIFIEMKKLMVIKKLIEYKCVIKGVLYLIICNIVLNFLYLKRNLVKFLLLMKLLKDNC